MKKKTHAGDPISPAPTGPRRAAHRAQAVRLLAPLGPTMRPPRTPAPAVLRRSLPPAQALVPRVHQTGGIRRGSGLNRYQTGPNLKFKFEFKKMKNSQKNS